MKICSNCGNKLADEDKKCNICKTSSKSAIPVENENDKERIDEIVASVRAKGSGQVKKKSKGLKTTVIIFVVLVVLGAIINGTKSDSNQKGVNTSNPIEGENATVSTEPKQEKKPNLELLDAEPVTEQYARYIVGNIRNNTNKEYSYVQVEINLYKGETLVGSTLANINNLGAGETWQFKAMVLQKDAESFKIKDITGF